MKIEDLHSIYFLGIGGIGMSALARYFLKRGVAVSGYDKTRSSLTSSLEAEGAVISYVDSPFTGEYDICVYTPAVPQSHMAYSHFRQQEISMIKRAELLGLISRSHSTYAVAGTHGKTTTSAMLSHIFNVVLGEVNAFVGGIMTNYNTNYLFADNTASLVVEADEYDRSFLQLSPKAAIITGVEADHLDVYGSSEAMSTSFIEFAGQVKDILLIHSDVKLKPNSAKVYTYGRGKADVELVETHIEQGMQRVEVTVMGKHYEFKLALPGEHNALNAIAAFGLAVLSGHDANKVASAMTLFKGVKRRFEEITRTDKVVYIDDYAHHPTELDAAIAAARQFYPGKRVAGIFQPHLYSRTRDFEEGFAKSLSRLDILWLLDIYPAREEPIPGISSENLLHKITCPEKQMATKETITKQILDKKYDVLLSLGAGDIDRLVEPLKMTLSSE